MIVHLLHTLAANGCAQVSGTNFCTGLPEGTASGSNLQHLLQIVIATLAAIAVLIIVIAGLNIVVDGSDAQKVAKARSAIVYALIGLIIAISAEAIVTFVVKGL